MPTPVPPDPADRSSVRRATDGTHIRKPAPEDAPTHTSNPQPVHEPPTVISSQRGTRFDPNMADALAGRKLGPFELIEGVGAGGMAAVLRARDADLGRVVALKILPPDMAADPENVIRFKQEARSAALLDHDNVARVYHCGEDQGLYFIAFEFVEGDNLRQVMEAHGGTVPVPDAVSIMLQVAAGLAHASARGVVHRDIKPSNIIVTPDGRAKIVDMGLAKSLDARHNGQLTQSGVTLGTFDYISPEQAIDPRAADVRSDIYSLGCTFYHALTGQVPVPEGTAAAKLDAQKNLLPPDPRTFNPAIPADLAVILGRMMAKEPDRRYQHPDPLAAHLRGLARKLGLPATLVPLAGPAEDPVPPPPRLSAAWALTACAVIGMCVVIFTNAFREPQPLPPWTEGQDVALLDPPVEGPPPVRVAASAPQSAATVAEFVSLLRAGATHIRLTGPEYDLWTYRAPAGQPADLVLAGETVKLESDAGAEIVMGFAPDGPARANTLTVRGTGPGSALVRGIRFKLVGPADATDVGLAVSGFAQVGVEDCVFLPSGRRAGTGPAALSVGTKGVEADLKRCYFAPGGTAVAFAGPGNLRAEQCAIAPHQAGVKVSRPAGSVGEASVTLVHCSALLRTGSVVDVDGDVPCAVSAGHCLFAGPNRFGPQADPAPAVLKQMDLRASGSRYEARAAFPFPMPNAYHNMLACADADGGYTFDEASKKGLPVRDVERPLPHPFESRDPFTLLDSNAPDPKRAFIPDRHQPELRIPGDRDGLMFGSRYLGRDPLYPDRLPPPGKADRDATVKVWDPTATLAGAPPGVYPTLKRALAEVEIGDTLLIRYTGVLEVDEFEIDEKMSLTIRPEANSKPVLVPARAVARKKQGMFKVFGRLVLDGLQFRLPADRPPAIAVLPGGGHFELRNAVVTFEDGEDLAAVILADPKNEMMMGTAPAANLAPKVVVENSLLRGKGRLLAVPVSRPFELDVKNTLAALDETLIDIDPAPTDAAGAGAAVVRLTRVTTYLGESLLALQAADRKPDAASGLVKTDVHATQCLFLPAREAREAFIRTDRLDTEDQVRRALTWSGAGNVYGYEKKKVMLEQRPAEVPAMPGKVIEGDEWLKFAAEEAGDPFLKVSFLIQGPDAGRAKAFAGVRPRDFRSPAFEPARTDACGVDPDQLPVPAE